MKKLLILLLVCAVSINFMTIQTFAETAKSEKKDAAKEDYLTTTEAFLLEMEEDVKAIGKKIENASDELQTQFDELVPQFEQSLDNAQKTLAELKNSEIWQDMQTEMDMAAEDVKLTYYKLMAKVSTSKEDYQAYAEMRLNDLNQHIDKLEAQMAEVSSEAKAKMQEALKSLKQQQQAVQAELEKLQAATSENWENLKTDLNSALEELQAAYDNAKKELTN